MATTLQDFAAQLDRCVETANEQASFIEAFAEVRIKLITRALMAPPASATWPDVPDADWADAEKLATSGIPPNVGEAAHRMYLHIDVALEADQSLIDRYVAMTGVSDKQRRVIFPKLCSKVGRPRTSVENLAPEIQKLNAWLERLREKGFEPERFIDYQRSLSIHGNSQNVSGQIGTAGATCAFLDAVEELDPTAIIDVYGDRVSAHTRSPAALVEWIAEGNRVPRSALLSNGRAIVFPSDPDVAIFEPLGRASYDSAEQAFAAYESVRRDQQARRQRVHEYVVGEVKTATDPANLHERLALGSRETRDEVRVDRFLMMSVLTREILRGGQGQRSSRSLENRDVVRFSDVFNLHFAWGWDGGRETHAQHWEHFKARLKTWCGL